MNFNNLFNTNWKYFNLRLFSHFVKFYMLDIYFFIVSLVTLAVILLISNINQMHIHSRHSEYTETSPAAFNSALDLAASLPFRPGAAKVVVLIHCSSCSFSENYANTLERWENIVWCDLFKNSNLQPFVTLGLAIINKFSWSL